MRTVTVVLSMSAESSLRELQRFPNDKRALSIVRALERTFQMLSTDPFIGKPIPRRLFPERLRHEYGLLTLHRVELPNFWRLLYTVRTRESETTCTVLILRIFDHHDYDNLFGYKKT